MTAHPSPFVLEQAESIFKESSLKLHCFIDRLIAKLMLFQWFVAIVIAYLATPLSWEGARSQTHVLVWASWLMGGLITLVPVSLTWIEPGRANTRYIVAASQMLMSALLIHLSGGRIETHFHVFVSLAFLAFYRDWRVLLAATLVIGSDHILRGLFWPVSVYGVLTANLWRTAEHILWVLFENVVLVLSIQRSIQEMRAMSVRQAELLETKKNVEEIVQTRTAQLEAQQVELLQARDRALDLARTKAQFMANMSHEIRTPMNGIIGITDLVLESPLTSDQQQNLRMVKRSASGLLVIINDILDFSKMEAGKMKMESMVFPLISWVKETVSLLDSNASRKGLLLTFAANSDTPEHVRGDPGRLRQVLMNLMGNAIKFTEKGTVHVQVSADRTSIKYPKLRVEVRDTGIGIPADKQGCIFDSFAQADGSISRRYGGTGLGLSISSQLVHLMGGELKVESEPGQGSRFYFEVPLHESSASEVEAPSPPASLPDKPVPLHILLVEDNEVNQHVARSILKKGGHTSEVASNGRQAVRAYENGVFDLILMDTQMPEMSGFEAATLIREKERCSEKYTPIISLTANALVGDREKAIAVGMDDYLPKPIDGAQLLTKIQEVWHRFKKVA